MKSGKRSASVSAKIDALLARHRVRLTLGGEPTYVPFDPTGSEWNVTALGPTKLSYARALAKALIAQTLPHAIAVHSPGKIYPGELNPRWVLHLIWQKDGASLFMLPASARRRSSEAVRKLRDLLIKHLHLKARWIKGADPADARHVAWILPLDHDGRHFVSADWKLGSRLQLLAADGPAGLRLPLALLPQGINRRALTLEIRDDVIEIFLPPLLQPAFVRLLQSIATAASLSACGPFSFSGYLPPDESDSWSQLGIAADPGVLEINLPPAATDEEYAHWLTALERAGAAAHLRSFKLVPPNEQAGTGGGNHLLFGGPALAENPFFKRPQWVTSILRYWQHHPSLSYLFTGNYVGPSSQAPRPDESSNSLFDLEMAYQFLERLPRGDHRQVMGETLRHLHTDISGNTHRSEISFDKFWSAAFDGGCRGLIEFRALESLAHADWMSAVALLWRALAAMLLAKPFTRPLIDHGTRLHDAYFLPSWLWNDFELVLRDLRRAGLALEPAMFRPIFDWRFPILLNHRDGAAHLTVRKAHEGWPLLCETPLEGGQTSRFVDSSVERLEFLATRQLAERCHVFVQGRHLSFRPFSRGRFAVGLRYRRTALYPSLHPGIRPQLPLLLEIKCGRSRTAYELTAADRFFKMGSQQAAPPIGRPLRKANDELWTVDLRLP